jgi:hypothetical protein
VLAHRVLEDAMQDRKELVRVATAHAVLANLPLDCLREKDAQALLDGILVDARRGAAARTIEYAHADCVARLGAQISECLIRL